MSTLKARISLPFDTRASDRQRPLKLYGCTGQTTKNANRSYRDIFQEAAA
jgi:hypothetical protein